MTHIHGHPEASQMFQSSNLIYSCESAVSCLLHLLWPIVNRFRGHLKIIQDGQLDFYLYNNHLSYSEPNFSSSESLKNHSPVSLGVELFV